MKKGIQLISLFITLSILFAGCSSTTLIQSNPGKAKVYINGAFVGETPYQHTDDKIIGSSMLIRLEKEGFETLVQTITKDEEVNVVAAISGLVVVVPLLWATKYHAEHTYELLPLKPENESKPAIQNKQPNSKSKADRLREFKKLLDEKIITPEEFAIEKAKILDEKE